MHVTKKISSFHCLLELKTVFKWTVSHEGRSDIFIIRKHFHNKDKQNYFLVLCCVKIYKVNTTLIRSLREGNIFSVSIILSVS